MSLRTKGDGNIEKVLLNVKEVSEYLGLGKLKQENC